MKTGVLIVGGGPGGAASAMFLAQQGISKEGIYSIPIGSRYHPERAPLWHAKSEVESTEVWMGPR